MSLLLLRSEQPAYHFTLCLTGREWLQSGVHLRRPDQVVKRDSDSPERLSAFARPRLYCTSRETLYFHSLEWPRGPVRLSSNLWSQGSKGGAPCLRTHVF